MMERRRFAYLIQCNHPGCEMWSGYVSRWTFEAPKKINTICTSCHRRLRHTHGIATGSVVNNRYRPKSGAHNKSTSVWRIRPFSPPSKCKSEASKMNREILRVRKVRGKKGQFENRLL